MRNTLDLPYAVVEFSTWISPRLIARHDNKKNRNEVR